MDKGKKKVSDDTSLSKAGFKFNFKFTLRKTNLNANINVNQKMYRSF